MMALVIEPLLTLVPAGPFVMGTSDEQIDLLAAQDEEAAKWRARGYFAREQPRQEVTLGEFSIGVYPVTVGEYRRFVEMGGYADEACWTAAGWSWRETVSRVEPAYWGDPVWTGDENLPVVGVSWYEACAYCRWLALTTGRPYRLPTEAEWEKTARGTDDRLYPWGDSFQAELCNTRASEVGRTVAVDKYGVLGQSPFGCRDMGGNASDWTLTKFLPYPYQGSDGRDDHEGETERVIRGGSWFKPPLRSRVAVRGYNDPWFDDNDVGFRCVLAGEPG